MRSSVTRLRRRPQTRHRHTALGDALVGAAVGVLATWVMDRVTTAWYNAESPAVRRLEDNTRGGATAYALAAERAAHAFGRDVSRETRDQLGNGIHWVLGATTGAVYGA